MTRPVTPDLYGDLVEVAAQPGFYDWLAMVKATGGCAHPIHLWGQSRTIDTTSGEILAQRSPGRLLIACGNRRATRCPSCSETYRADTYQLIRAGLVGGKTIPAAVADHPRLFATFTAPSFGPVHHRPEHPTKPTGPCHPGQCGRLHLAGDPTIGQPLDPATYDYTGAVIWNALATRLWARTMKLTNRRAATLLHIRQREWAASGRVSAAKVAEYQARGLVHFHAIFRLDGPNPTDPTPVGATVELLGDAITQAARHVNIAVPACPELSGHASVAWGAQLDLRPVARNAEEGEVDDSQVAGYIAKYATKGAETAGTIDRPIACATCAGIGQHSDCHRCADCRGSGLRIPIDSLDVTDHGRAMIQTCWQLGAIPELRHLRLRPWAHTLGFRGHFSTKTRRYSTTLSELRGARQQWRSQRVLEAHGLDLATAIRRIAERDLDELADDDQVLVIGSWVYVGRGHSNGESVYAATIAADRAESRWAARQAPTEEWEV